MMQRAIPVCYLVQQACATEVLISSLERRASNARVIQVMSCRASITKKLLGCTGKFNGARKRGALGPVPEISSFASPPASAFGRPPGQLVVQLYARPTQLRHRLRRS